MSDEDKTAQADASFVYELRRVTEATARAAAHWIGRGDKSQSDAAAVSAMHDALDLLSVGATVVVGAREKDDGRAPYHGELVGDKSSASHYDLAVDPVEGTTYLAKGMTNAMAVMAMSPRGTMFDPRPCFYMEKFVADPRAQGKVDPSASTGEKLRQLASALDKPISQITVYVLEKPRHKELVAEIYDAGARVALYPAGDIAGALMAAIPESGIDALMGTGGTPEGIIAACAIRVMGGEFLGRLDPQLPSEQVAVREKGLDTSRWYRADELVTSENVFFCATGITTGLLFSGVEQTRNYEQTQTLMIAGPAGERQLLTTWHRLPQ